eukprot:scaffold7363_cov263-Pinguiococcus_pyrenoidosus.AAC.19
MAPPSLRAWLLLATLCGLPRRAAAFRSGVQRRSLRRTFADASVLASTPLRAQKAEEFEDVYYEECSFYADATACAMETLIDVTSQEQFDFIISHAAGADPLSPDQKPHKMVMLMVHATWCRKCKYLMKQYLKVAKAHPEVLCLKLNLATNAEVGKSLGIRGVPLFIIYKAGKRIDHFYAENADDLEEQVEDNV